MHRLLVPFIVALAVGVIPLIAAESCPGLADLQLPDTMVTSASLQTGGSFTPPNQKNAITGLPDFCRVEATIRPSPDSIIRMEVWLPATGWNGKFQGVGNGGFAGSLNYGPAGLPTAVKRGYAAASTDTGHSVDGVDASWALGHPEKLTDYGHRAIHLMTVRAKEMVRAFYGEGPRRSYFSSCSNGGRQALMEAQRYPADYDGIIAGAPANDFTNLAIDFTWNLHALAKAPLPAETVTSIEAAVLQACDEVDGLKDGLIADPTACRIDPAKVVEGPAAQTLKAIYSGPRTSKGKELFSGFPPGAESGPGGWFRWMTAKDSLQSAFLTHILRYMAFDNPAYDPLKFDFDRDPARVHAKLAGTLNATDPNLSPFHKRGGKLILFHGWNDPAIPAGSTLRYYDAIPSSAKGSVRLYMAPSVQHCGSGPGPNSFGAYGEGGAEMFKALEDWVENGKAPERIVATKFNIDGNPTSGVKMTRPLCPYPQVARYKGSGSIDQESSFECVQKAGADGKRENTPAGPVR